MLQPVYIVGAGPGDPDLITVKGRSLLVKADVIIYANSLIPDSMLQVCRADAEIIPTASKSLEEILTITIDRVRSHKLVVRLHDGDPSLYGAIQEQIVGLTEAEIPFEIIPGVSAFQLAAARLQVELTIPELVQTIILTRISGRTQVPETEELSNLAAHQASLCLYLSANHVETVQSKLMEHYPSDTTVAICYRLGWEDEKVLTVPLSAMAFFLIEENLKRSTLFLISPALNNLNGSMQKNTKSELKSEFKSQFKSQLYSTHYKRHFREI